MLSGWGTTPTSFVSWAFFVDVNLGGSNLPQKNTKGADKEPDRPLFAPFVFSRQLFRLHGGQAPGELRLLPGCGVGMDHAPGCRLVELLDRLDQLGLGLFAGPLLGHLFELLDL